MAVLQATDAGSRGVGWEVAQENRDTPLLAPLGDASAIAGRTPMLRGLDASRWIFATCSERVA